MRCTECDAAHAVHLHPAHRATQALEGAASHAQHAMRPGAARNAAHALAACARRVTTGAAGTWGVFRGRHLAGGSRQCRRGDAARGAQGTHCGSGQCNARARGHESPRRHDSTECSGRKVATGPRCAQAQVIARSAARRGMPIAHPHQTRIAMFAHAKRMGGGGMIMQIMAGGFRVQRKRVGGVRHATRDAEHSAGRARHARTSPCGRGTLRSTARSRMLAGRSPPASTAHARAHAHTLG